MILDPPLNTIDDLANVLYRIDDGDNRSLSVLSDNLSRIKTLRSSFADGLKNWSDSVEDLMTPVEKEIIEQCQIDIDSVALAAASAPVVTGVGALLDELHNGAAITAGPRIKKDREGVMDSLEEVKEMLDTVLQTINLVRTATTKYEAEQTNEVFAKTGTRLAAVLGETFVYSKHKDLPYPGLAHKDSWWPLSGALSGSTVTREDLTEVQDVAEMIDGNIWIHKENLDSMEVKVTQARGALHYRINKIRSNTAQGKTIMPIRTDG